MATIYYDVPASPYPTSGDITIQGEVHPIQKHMRGVDVKTGDYMIYPRSLVFTYAGETNQMSGSRRIGNKQVRVGSALNVFSSFRAIPANAGEIGENSIRFVGVAFEGIANGKDAKNFPVECGRLAVLVSGATTIYCASDSVRGAKFGDILCWTFNHDENGRVQHGDADFRFVGLEVCSNSRFKKKIQAVEEDEVEEAEVPPEDEEEEGAPVDGMSSRFTREFLDGFGSRRGFDLDELRSSSSSRMMDIDGDVTSNSFSGTSGRVMEFLVSRLNKTIGSSNKAVNWPVWVSNEGEIGRSLNPMCYFPATLSGSDLDATSTNSFFSRVNKTVHSKKFTSLVPEQADIFISSPNKNDIEWIGQQFPDMLDSHKINTFSGFDYANDDVKDEAVYQIPFTRSDAVNPLSTKAKIQSYLNRNVSQLERPSDVSFGADLNVIKQNMDKFRTHYDSANPSGSIESRYSVTSEQLKKLSPDDLQFLKGTLSKNVNYNNIDHYSETGATIMEHPLLVKDMLRNVNTTARDSFVSNTRASMKTSLKSSGRRTSSNLSKIGTSSNLSKRGTSMRTFLDSERRQTKNRALAYSKTGEFIQTGNDDNKKTLHPIGMVLDYDESTKSLRILMEPTKYLDYMYPSKEQE